MDLTAPDGSQWRVERRWLPWRLRRRDPDVAADAAMDATSAADGVLLALGLFLLLLVVTVALPWVLVGAVITVELVLLLLLLPLAVVLRALRVSGWPLDVRREGRLVHAERVRGWRASGGRLQELRDAVGRGDLPGASPLG